MTEPSDNSSGSTCLQCGKPLTSCTCATVFVSGEEAIVGSEEGGRRGLSRGDVLDGRYRIVRIIGTGGMGTVYEAEHVVLLNRVALKIMRPEFLSDRMVTARFEQEARACAALTHANLVSVQDCGATDNGEPYLVMEFLQGHNLIEIINVEKRLDLDRFFGIFLPVVKGLSYAHQNGVIHRDLKPGNIIIIEGPEGRDLPKIVDFGVAKLDDLGPAMQMLTQTGEVFGSPSYMSPEQCKGLPVDARSDIYSLGCVMYEALTGKQAFAGHNIMTILHSQLNEAPKELTAAIGDDSIPEALVDVIMQCLEKEREDRFDSCEDLLAHMQKAKDDMLGSYRLSFGRLRMSGENLLAYLVALAVVVGLLASWLFFHGESSHIGSHKFPEGVETRALVKSLVATYSEIQEFDDYARKSYQESLKSAIAGKASPETQVVLALPLIRLLRHSRRYDEAVNVYQQVKPALDAMRTTGDVDSIARPAANAGSMLFYYAAESLEKKKETDRAIETFQFGVEFSEKLQASAWVKAKLYEQYGKSIEDKKQFVDTARKCFENVIELLDGETDDIKDECRGMRARAHLSLANIFEAKKKFDLSSREFDQAIKIYQAGKEKDNENRSREKLVQFLIRRKDYQAARVEAEAMFAHPGVSKTLLMNLPSIKSVSPMVLADRGVFLKKERLPGYEASLLAALDRADKAKLDDLDKLSIAFLLMTGYFDDSEDEKIEKLYRRVQPSLGRLLAVLDRAPSGGLGVYTGMAPVLCLDSAASFIREDKLELAQKVLEDGLRLVKGQPDETYVRARLLAQFGLLFKKQGRLEEAKNKLNDSIKMLDSYTGRRHRSYGDSLAALAEVYAEGGDYEKAYRTINDAISAVKDDPWISWRVGDYQRMRAEIKKRQQSRP